MQEIQKLVSVLEKYRPKSWDEIIGHGALITELKRFVKTKRIHNLLFRGVPGVGKTSVAHIVANAFVEAVGEGNVVEFNASDDRGIDFVRGEIKKIVGLDGLDIIILDEAESLTDEAQAAMQRLAEKALENGKFMIITANKVKKFIHPIMSRFKIITFGLLAEDEIAKGVKRVLDGEKIDYSSPEQKSFIGQIIRRFNGDLRATLGEILWYVDESGTRIEPNPEMVLYQSVVDQYRENILKKIILEGKWGTLREDVITIMFRSKPSLMPYQMVDLAEEWLIELLKEKKISNVQYDKGLRFVAECDYRLTHATKPMIQIVGMLSGLRLLFTQGTKR